MRNTEIYNLKRSVTIEDEYGQMRKNDYSTITSLPISVTLYKENFYTNNPNFSDITHIGLYKGNFSDFRKLDRLNNDYSIKEIIKENRKTLLFLQEVN